MKNSQLAVVSALGFCCILIVALLEFGRMAVSDAILDKANVQKNNDMGVITTDNEDLKDFQDVVIKGVWDVTIE